MKELAITVAVWHTEFRTASWSEREKKYIEAHEEVLSDRLNNSFIIYVLKNHLSFCYPKLPSCFSGSLDLCCCFGLGTASAAQWPSPR